MNEQSYLAHMRAAEKRLYHITCAMLSCESDRQDAMAETALRCWAHRDSLKNEEYFTTWSVRILINVCRTMFRGRKYELCVENVPERPDRGGALDDLEMRSLLESLPEKTRVITIMYYLEGMSVREVAQAIGVPEGTVKFRLHQARKALQLELLSGREEWA